MATISPVRIANMALSNIGASSTIESLTEESTEAKQANLWYDWSRLQVLELHDWSFARKRRILANHSEDPPDIWGYRYQYPDDCVIMMFLQNPALDADTADAVPFDIESDDAKETKTILTSLEDAVGVYTFDQVTTSLFTPLFVEMLAAMLSYHMAFSITGDRGNQEAQLQKLLLLGQQATDVNSNEEVKKPPRDAEWHRGR